MMLYRLIASIFALIVLPGWGVDSLTIRLHLKEITEHNGSYCANFEVTVKNNSQYDLNVFYDFRHPGITFLNPDSLCEVDSLTQIFALSMRDINGKRVEPMVVAADRISKSNQRRIRSESKRAKEILAEEKEQAAKEGRQPLSPVFILAKEHAIQNHVKLKPSEEKRYQVKFSLRQFDLKPNVSYELYGIFGVGNEFHKLLENEFNKNGIGMIYKGCVETNRISIQLPLKNQSDD